MSANNSGKNLLICISKTCASIMTQKKFYCNNKCAEYESALCLASRRLIVLTKASLVFIYRKWPLAQCANILIQTLRQICSRTK